MAGKPGGWNAGMPEVQKFFEPPSLPASQPQAHETNNSQLVFTQLGKRLAEDLIENHV